MSPPRLSLAGIGPDRTMIEIWADPAIDPQLPLHRGRRRTPRASRCRSRTCRRKIPRPARSPRSRCSRRCASSHAPLRVGDRQPLIGRRARVHDRREVLAKPFQAGSGKSAPGCGTYIRRLHQLQRRDVARAIGKDRPRRHAHDQLRADGRAAAADRRAHRRRAVDAQPLGLDVHIDEQRARRSG